MSCKYSGCKGLVTINLPAGIKEIGWYTFYRCTSLLEIDIPNSVTKIGLYAFSGCTSLNSVTIPSSVITIDQYAFNWCTSLTEIKIPNSVESIGESAFNNCTALSDVNIGNNVKNIKQNAFAGCSTIKSLKIPDSVKSIEASAFRDCYNLDNIILGSGVSTIGNGAFFNSSQITKIYSKAVAPPSLAADKSFATTTYSWATLYVPNGSLKLYRSANYWNKFVDIREFSPSEIDSGSSTEPMESDTEISLLDNVVYIENFEASAGSQKTLFVKMKNAVTAEGFGFDLYLPDGVTVARDADGFPMVELSTQRTTARKTNSFDAAFQSDGSLRVLAASTNGSAINGNDGEVCLITINIANDMAEGDYPILLKNIAISDVDAVSHRTEQVKSTLTISAYTSGDSNNDGVIDVSDFTATAHYLLGNAPTGFNVKAADANADGVVDVADLTAVAHIILYGSINRPSSTPILNSINPQ